MEKEIISRKKELIKALPTLFNYNAANAVRTVKDYEELLPMLDKNLIYKYQPSELAAKTGINQKKIYNMISTLVNKGVNINRRLDIREGRVKSEHVTREIESRSVVVSNENTFQTTGNVSLSDMLAQSLDAVCELTTDDKRMIIQILHKVVA